MDYRSKFLFFHDEIQSSIHVQIPVNEKYRNKITFSQGHVSMEITEMTFVKLLRNTAGEWNQHASTVELINTRKLVLQRISSGVDQLRPNLLLSLSNSESPASIRAIPDCAIVDIPVKIFIQEMVIHLARVDNILRINNTFGQQFVDQLQYSIDQLYAPSPA